MVYERGAPGCEDYLGVGEMCEIEQGGANEEGEQGEEGAD